MSSIKLFTTLGCHLCEQAQALLEDYQHTHACLLQIERVEIALDEKLVEQYGIRIPVLQHGAHGGELAWPFNQEKLKVFLES